MSVKFNKHIKSIFFETDNNYNYNIPLNDFLVKSFTYDSECRVLVASLYKSFSLMNVSDYEMLGNGMELELSNIKIDLVYCLYNESIIRCEIKSSFTENNLVSSVTISNPLKINLN